MAAGRHGGYRDNEFRGREADTEVSRREIEYSKGVYDRNRVPIQDRSNGDDGSRIRRRDTNGREVMNGGYKSSSRSRSRSNSRSDSGSSGGGNGVRRGGGGGGGSRIRDYIVSGVDREPGELSSESSESDEAIESDSQVKKFENGFDQSKKRKYSPIIWDREEKEANMKLKNQNSPSFTNLPPPPPLPKPQTKLTSESSPEKLNSLVSESQTESPVRLIPSEEALLSNNHGEDEDFAPTRNIKSSRWANEGDSSPDEGEISQDEELKKKKSLTPELKARSRSKSTESEECVMEIDTNSNESENKSYTDSENEHNSSPEPIQVPQMVPQRRVNMLQGCRSVEEFERLNKIDEGTYGVVFRAKDTKSGEIVALKKVKMEKEREGFPMTSLREINILLSFHHPSIIDVKEVVVGSSLDSIFMVMEYMEHDLKGLMETMKQPYSQSEVKCLMLQLLEGVKYLHDNWVLHRDLKTSNLLLNNCGELKICDFGLARQYGSPLKPYTHLVVTLWYRAPELLLGTKLYSTAIDMWSLGCIMAELLSKKPLFNGRAEVDQLDKIFKTLGTPNETIWPGFTKLPGVKVNFAKHPYNQLRKLFPPTSFTGAPVLSDSGFDLLNKLLTYDPERRISAEDALNHEWFREVPLPKSKEFMPTFPAQHAQDRRTRRVMKSPDPLEEQRLKELQGGLGTGGVFG